MQNFPKKWHFLLPDTHTHVRNVSFLGNFAYVLDEWSLSVQQGQENKPDANKKF